MATLDCYELRAEGANAEQKRWNCVLHFVLLDDQAASLYDTSLGLATIGMAKWVEHLLPLQTNESTIQACRANRIWPSIGIPAEDGTGAAAGGVSASEPLPADVAAVVTKRTDLPGKSGRGRMYFGNLTEADQDAGILTAFAAGEIISAFESFATELMQDINGNDWGLVVFSPKLLADAAPFPYTASNRLQIDRVLRKMTPRGTSVSIRVSPL